MATLRTIVEAELGPESIATELQAFKKAQQELDAILKQSGGALFKDQAFTQKYQQINQMVMGLEKTVGTMIAQKKQQQAAQPQPQQQQVQNQQQTPVGANGPQQPQQQAGAQTQNVTPRPGQPAQANGSIPGVPKRTV